MVDQKAYSALMDHDEVITSGKQAKKIKGIGDSSAKKIDEFLETGKIEALEEVRARKNQVRAEKGGAERERDAEVGERGGGRRLKRWMFPSLSAENRSCECLAGGASTSFQSTSRLPQPTRGGWRTHTQTEQRHVRIPLNYMHTAAR